MSWEHDDPLFAPLAEIQDPVTMLPYDYDSAIRAIRNSDASGSYRHARDSFPCARDASPRERDPPSWISFLTNPFQSRNRSGNTIFDWLFRKDDAA